MQQEQTPRGIANSAGLAGSHKARQARAADKQLAALERVRRIDKPCARGTGTGR